MNSTAVICQVCDYEAQFDLANEPELWKVAIYEGPKGKIKILTCPLCTEMLDSADIIEGYFERIRSGRDPNVH